MTAAADHAVKAASYGQDLTGRGLWVRKQVRFCVLLLSPTLGDCES